MPCSYAAATPSFTPALSPKSSALTINCFEPWLIVQVVCQAELLPAANPVRGWRVGTNSLPNPAIAPKDKERNKRPTQAVHAWTVHQSLSAPTLRDKPQ